jgi:hypothetical protein
MSLKGSLKGYKPEHINYLRRMSTAALVRECEEAEIFDEIYFEQINGRPDSFVSVSRGKYRVMLIRGNLLLGKELGFRATDDKPTLITLISADVSGGKPKRVTKDLGTWSTLPLLPGQRATFEKPEKKDPVFSGFLHDVLQIFS